MNQSHQQIHWISLDLPVPDKSPPAAVDPDSKLRPIDKIVIGLIVVALCAFWFALGFLGTRLWLYLTS